MNELAYTIEGILFYEAESVTVSELCEICRENEESVQNALSEIKTKYSNAESCIQLLVHKDTYQLVVAGKSRDVILARDVKEREGELSRPALETLSTILYLGQASKSQIDYIRGVQSSYMLRILSSRGLLSRVGKMGRDTVYAPTVETLRFMGITRPEDMPEFESISAEFRKALSSVSESRE